VIREGARFPTRSDDSSLRSFQRRRTFAGFIQNRLKTTRSCGATHTSHTR
jgi:hypothetical protein